VRANVSFVGAAVSVMASARVQDGSNARITSRGHPPSRAACARMRKRGGDGSSPLRTLTI
jgi:hypothetical protein